MNNNKIVMLEWLDSVEYEDAEWKTKEDIDKLVPMKIKSDGVLVHDDNFYITIASSVNETDLEDITYGGLLTIPKCSLLKRSDFPRSFTSE